MGNDGGRRKKGKSLRQIMNWTILHVILLLPTMRYQ